MNRRVHGPHSSVGPWLSGVLLATLLAGPAAAEVAGPGKPARIVSMNLCTDQLVLALADRERIASLSYLVHDSATSVVADQARGLHANHGQVEEIIALEPDLVITGRFSARVAAAALKRLGYRVLDVPVATDIETIRSNIELVAGAVGQSERGAVALARFDLRLAGLRNARPASGPRAVLYRSNGYTDGGGTLASAVLALAGWRNVMAERGVRGSVHLPLETLITLRPNVLVIGEQRQGQAIANEILRHPALGRLFADQRRVRVDDRLWTCGTPMVAEAAERLARHARVARASTSQPATGRSQ